MTDDEGTEISGAELNASMQQSVVRPLLPSVDPT